MSSRQLRKLQQQRELEKAQEANIQEANDSDDSEKPVQPATKPRPSVFAVLGGGDDDKDEDEEEDGGNADTPLTQDAGPSFAEPASSGLKSKKKRKKQKKTKKTKSAVSQEVGTEAEDEVEDEIDKAIKELKLASNSAQYDHSSSEEKQNSTSIHRRRMNEILSINTYHLRAINEMRNLFGREIIESANVEEQQEQGSRRRQRMQQQVDLETFLREPPNAKKLPEVSLRRNVFIQGRDHWPCQSAGGLTMKEEGNSADGIATEYAYLHGKDYDAIQAFFFACVQIGDPMRMVHLLKRAPYHVSTLLQVSSVAKQDQNMALAAELCERALFAFGRVTTSAFRQDIEHGRARFDFRRPENRQFWLAGYHYLRSLVRKGTYRTALEWAKLLYALDPSDPYAMRHYIHFLAVRAYESKWLIDFIEQMEKLGDHPDITYLRQSLALAKLQTNDAEGARAVLKAGIQAVPWLYCALFQELNLDAPASIWGVNPTTDTRTFWVKLYIYQAKDLWNNAQATNLLQEVAKSQAKADVASLPSDDEAVDLGSARLAYLEGHTSLLAVAPRNLLDSQPNYEFDPLPPPEWDNIFTSGGTRLPFLNHLPESQGGTETDHLLAQLNHLIARQNAGDRLLVGGRGEAPAGAGVGAGGMFGMNNVGGDDDDVEDEEVRALRMADDEELQRDIEARMNLGNQPGFLGNLMRMLGVGRRQVDETNEVDEDEGEGDWDGPPGAWPQGDAPR
ncbi:hypothetical protein QQS21_005766 [Conoideocrella luteorostrata]|uniref:Transcription factor 25 n=1 Tax=Conoideocrella luteorostrata TaxID=1105319 RepID=A0AAJ0G0P7_9HYPO|nr:hypothetical protein QQS21_005766 [Conoideocrella luteorostrata]